MAASSNTRLLLVQNWPDHSCNKETIVQPVWMIYFFLAQLCLMWRPNRAEWRKRRRWRKPELLLGAFFIIKTDKIFQPGYLSHSFAVELFGL